MLRLKFIFLLVLLVSCTKYSTYEKKSSGSIYITPSEFKINEAEDVKWKVGRKKDQLLSKGINVKFTFPLLEKDHLRELLELHDVNAWIIKIVKLGFSRARPIGYMYVPLSVPTPQRKYSYKQIKTGTFSIVYAAASISTRFEKFPCPAFDHRLIIEDFEIKDKKTFGEKVISVTPTQQGKINAKISKFSYSTYKINGGTSIKGDYGVEIALFDSIKKRRKSNFVNFPQVVRVLSEKKKSITGCAGYKIPDRPRESGGVKAFKFGQ